MIEKLKGRGLQFVVLGGLLFNVAFATPVSAQPYPTKAVTFVVPYPPGGRTDLTARVVAEFLKEELGQPVVVANHPGASGVIGARKVATAAPDGYTLGFFSLGVVVTQYTVPVPSDLKDYEPISLINVDPATLAVNAASSYRNLQEFVSYARAHPNQLVFGTTPGAGAQFLGSAFWRAAGGLKFREVPYVGGGERAVALAGKHIDADIDVPAIYKGLIEAGKLRILAIGAETRDPLYKDWPTFREQGIDYVRGSWHGVFAPRGTAQSILSILDKALEGTSRNPRFVNAMHKALIGVRYLNREEFIRFLTKEDASIQETVKELNLRRAK